MNYDLVKKLKDAGFTQTFPDGRWYYTDEACLEYACEDHGSVHPKQTHGIVPTLEELIEACRGRTIKLWVTPSGQAGVQLEGQGLEDVEFYKTPAEAVANLWLELNKKDHGNK